MSEDFKIVYFVHDNKLGTDSATFEVPITMSDAEIEIEGLIREKVKAAGREATKGVVRILRRFMGEMPTNSTRR